MRRLAFVCFVCALLATGCIESEPDVLFPIHINIDGPGSVLVQPLSRTCASSCVVYAKPRTNLLFTALPDVPNGFRRWGTHPQCGTEQCSFSADGPNTIRAEFYSRGDALWASTYDDIEPPLPHLNIFADGADQVRIVGQFDETLDLGTGELAGTYASNLFTAVLTADGKAASAVALASADVLYAQADIATDGDLLVGGWFEGDADLGDGPRTSGAPGSLFIARYTPAGANVWAFQFDDVEMERLDHIGVHAASDNGMFLRVNFLTGAFDLGGGLLTEGPFGESTAVARFDSAGAHVWSDTLGDATSDNLVSVVQDDDLVLAGNYGGIIDLNGITYSAATNGHVLLARLSGLDGSHVDSNTYFGGGNTDIRAIYLTPDGDFLVSAFIGGSINFGGGNLVNTGDPYAPALARFSGTDLSHQYSWVGNGSGFGVFHELRFIDGGARVLASGVVGDSMTLGEISVNSIGFSDAMVAEIDAATGEVLFARVYGGENADAAYRGYPLDNGDAIIFGAFRNATEIDTVELTGNDLTTFAARLLQFVP